MYDTTYVEDGVTYEAVYTESETLDMIAGFDIHSMKIRGSLQKFAENVVDNCHKRIPGLADKSWIERFKESGEQYASAMAAMNLVDTKYPKLHKILFRKEEPLYNLAMAMAIAAFDQRIDMYIEDMEKANEND